MTNQESTEKNETAVTSIWHGSKWLIFAYVIGILCGIQCLLESVAYGYNLLDDLNDPNCLFGVLVLIAAFITTCGRWRLVGRGLFPRGKAWNGTEAKNIADYFWTLSRVTGMLGVVSVLLIIITALSDFDPSKIIQIIYIALRSILYAVFVDLLFFMPVTVLAMKQLQKLQTANETLPPQPLRKTKALQFVGGWLIALLAVWGICFGEVQILFDLPSICAVGGSLIIYLAARKLFGKRPLNTEPTETTSRLFEKLAHVVLYGGLIGTAIGFAYMLYIRLNPEDIGRGIAMILLSQTYAIFLSVFVFTPLSVQLANENEGR
ncbi:MAG: hypothetical protein LBU65_16710 [Planctomycetaceae bacterium]|jgi:hypothetical protein|nr:hypothetical protein [Planctomycetaceae bacterium]